MFSVTYVKRSLLFCFLVFSTLNASWLENKYPSYSYVFNEFDIDESYIYDDDFISFVMKNENNLKRFYQRSLIRGKEILPTMQGLLVEDGVSDLFIYLSMVESGFTKDAVSPKKAVGLWQFMAATAKSRLLGVALNDVGPELAAKDLKRIFSYLGVPPTERSWADAAKSRAAQMPGFENVPHARWMQEVKNMFDQSAGGLSLRYDPQLREAVRHSFTEPSPDLWPLFDTLDGLPLCLLRGANSNLLSTQTSQKMFEKHPDMIKTEVPDRGHTPFLDEPEALEALHRWIKVMKK